MNPIKATIDRDKSARPYRLVSFDASSPSAIIGPDVLEHTLQIADFVIENFPGWQKTRWIKFPPHNSTYNIIIQRSR